jgi:vitamin B12/bleomycin/antimicrobial peptide transport system ATP-binding/permease protein
MAGSGGNLFIQKTDRSIARVKRFWRTAREYWKPGQSRVAWPLTVSMGAVVLASLAITYGLNLWNRHFFDALQAKDTRVALHQTLLFPLLVGGYLAMCVFAMWVRMTLQRTWRAFVNDRLLDRWLERSHYYQLELIDGDHKNPEHRINDDVRVATEMPVDFVTGFVTSVLSAATFFAVLWSVGGAIALPICGGLILPGYMLFAAFAYAIVTNGAMLAIGRKFVRTTQAKNQAEAEYRYSLARVRESAECIALLRGAKAERASIDKSFGALLARWTALVGQQMRAVIVSQGHAQLVGVVPLLLCTPKFLEGSMSLGQMMQVASAFGIVQGAMSWLVDNYPRIAEWMASVRRVASLLSAIDGLDKLKRARPARIFPQQGAAALSLSGLSVHLSDGAPLVSALTAQVKLGEKVLLVGDSGTGKSALVRALAGVWPWSRGEVAHPQSADICVIPQRPYVPAGSLRRAVTYPLPPECVGEDQVVDALMAVGLGRFVPKLHEEDLPWPRSLSEGEKQRLAFARVLIHRPDTLVLDEATSALHVQGQAELMNLLYERLPGLTLISIGHRPELEAFHQRKLILESAPAGARIVADEPIEIAPSVSPAAA